MSVHNLKIRHENGKVLFVIDGKGYRIPWEYADVLSRGFTMAARKAEEYCRANAIIMDNALMQRAGLPIGLSDHPVIKQESIKEALHNRRLRTSGAKAGIESIKSRGVVGSPSLLKRSVQ